MTSAPLFCRMEPFDILAIDVGLIEYPRRIIYKLASKVETNYNWRLKTYMDLVFDYLLAYHLL